MDLVTEIAQYQALLRYATSSGADLRREFAYQINVLKSLGATGGEINNIIHDRYGRAGISFERAKRAVASVRRAAGIIHEARGDYAPAEVSTRTSERTAEYLRRSGRSAPRPLPHLADLKPSFSVFKSSAAPMAPVNAQPVATVEPLLQESQEEKAIFSEHLLQSHQSNESVTVPYGVDPNLNFIRATDAVAGEIYKCPGCDALLTLKAGQKRVKHFAHKAATSCDGESLIHITAKVLLAKVMLENPTSTRRIRLTCSCSSCARVFDKVLGPDAFDGSIVEGKIDQFRCDVVGLRKQLPVLGVEILNTHRVDEHKAAALSIPWIELDAWEIVDDPYYWRSLNGRLKPTICEECRNLEAKLNTTAARWGLPTAPVGYSAAVAPCWGCKADIIWYWWQDVPFATQRPPEPIPSTLKYRYSKMYGGKYWMNTCPGCGSPQGDNFVFISSDSPFSHLVERNAAQETNLRVQATDAISLFKAVLRKNI